MSISITLQEIAQLVQGQLEGDPSVAINGVGSLDEAVPGQMTFVSDAALAGQLPSSKASAALVGASVPAAGIPLVRVKNVQAALAALLGYFNPGDDLPAVGIHPSAVVASSASLAADVAIGPFVVIGEGAVIGAGCVLSAGVKIGANVTLGEGCVLFENAVVRWGCRLGCRVRVGPGCVIGYDGFGYYQSQGKNVRVPHIGIVELQDDVDLGACVCVDRAKFGVTRVGAGTKIDNYVQVAHNVQIGQGCLLAAQVGLAGSCRLGNYVVMGGQVGVGDHVAIGDLARVGAQSGLLKDVPPGAEVFGTLAVGVRDFMRQTVNVGKLPELQRRVKELESRLNALESSKDH